MSAAPALTILQRIQTALQAADGAATVTVLGDSHTYNYDLSAAGTVVIGGDPVKGTDDVAVSVYYISSATSTDGVPVGKQAKVHTFEVVGRVAADDETHGSRVSAALNLAADLVVAVHYDYAPNGANNLASWAGAVHIRTDEAAVDGAEWGARAGLALVTVEVTTRSRLGL
jgi:hypothetical protein